MNATPDAIPSLPVNSNDRLWSVLCHLSTFFGFAILFPLVVYLVMRKDSPHVAEQAVEALNFHISLLIYGFAGVLLIFVFFIGIPVLIGLGLLSFICSIVAAVKSSDGVVYRYPMTIRFVK